MTVAPQDAAGGSGGIAPGTVIVVGSLDGLPRPAGLTTLSPGIHARWSRGPQTAEGADGTVSLDGVAIADGRLLRSGADLLRVWGGREPAPFAHWWGRHARQASCAYVWHAPTQRLVVLPDALGGATIFVHEVSGVQVLSSDYAALIGVLDDLGLRPEKDLMYQVERTVFGSGGLYETSHAGGRRVPTFTHLDITSSGLREVRYDAAPTLDQPRSYYEGLATVRADVLDSIAAIAAAPTEERIAHLTGGFDSRMVLGAILEAGVQDRFEFFCSGPPESRDREVADGLARTLGLVRSPSAGLVPHHVGSFSDQQLALLGYTAGMSNVGPTGTEDPLDVIAAGGGYGELFRSFYTHAITGQGPAPWSDGHALMTAMVGSAPDQGILSPRAFDLLAGRLTDVLTGIHDSGVPADFVGDVYYSDVRNRYHMGATSLSWSRVGARVNPLYSVSGLQAACELPGIARRANVLGYDLLESFGHDLSRYPFDKDRSSIEYRRQRRPRPGLPFAEGQVTWSTKPARPASGPAPAPMSAERREIVLKRAKALDIIFWQSVNLESTQAVLRRVLEQTDLSTYADVVNVSYLQDLARTGTWNRNRVRHLYSATTMLGWFGDESRP